MGPPSRRVPSASEAVVSFHLHDSLIGCSSTLKPAAECLWTSNIFLLFVQKRVAFEFMQIILHGLATVQSLRDRLLVAEDMFSPGILYG